ncbi:MAG: hypothetical protein AAB557_02750 [Patescibacteria group bacterium]
MSHRIDREPASDQELARRKEAMQSAGQKFLKEHPEVIVCVYVGSALKVVDPGDTDIVIIAEPNFIKTREEVDSDLWFGFSAVGLPHPDTFEVVKVRPESMVTIDNLERLLPENCPYGLFPVVR